MDQSNSPFTQQTPTTVVTGFLGAGKTTIIAHLIDYLQSKGEQVVYVKNEIGDATIDNQIMQGKNIQTKELLNGCICCTLTGPFIAAIDELVEVAKPDRIIIEASGTADASALALMISSHEKLYRDGVVTIIDVVNFQGFEDLSITAQNQTKFTDLIIFNKIEQVDLQRKQAVVGYVRELNNHSPIVEAPNGVVEPTVIFGISSKELDTLLLESEQNEADHALKHLEQDHMQAFTIKMDRSVNVDSLKDTLEKLPDNIFRVKGIIIDSDKKPWIIQKVAHRVDVQPFEGAGQPLSQSKVIFIGFEIENLEQNIRNSLTS